MKKTFFAMLIAIMAIALISSAAFAGETCGMKKTDAKATVQKASADGEFCHATAAKECSELLGVSEEECRELCESGKVTMVKMTVEGMTCGGCEKGVTTALEKVPGVVKVASVCHKSGSASFYFDTRKGNSADAVKAVSSQGYKTEIIPAVATMASDKVAHAGCDPAKCASKGSAGCSMTKSAEKTAEKTAADSK